MLTSYTFLYLVYVLLIVHKYISTITISAYFNISDRGNASHWASGIPTWLVDCLNYVYWLVSKYQALGCWLALWLMHLHN